MAEPQTEVENEGENAYDQLTGIQKSAILMMLLGEDEASEILKNLSPREVQNLGSAMYSVQGLDQETVNRVLDEFLEIIKQQTSLGLGAGNYIRNVLNRALGEDKAQSVLSRISPSSSNRPIEILDWMDARAISELVIDEHPQIIALVVSYLDYGLAADVLGCCRRTCNQMSSAGLRHCKLSAPMLWQSLRKSCSASSRRTPPCVHRRWAGSRLPPRS